MTAEIPKAPRTHHDFAAYIEEDPHVLGAWVSEEPYRAIAIQIEGIGIPPSVQKEIARAGLTIMPGDTRGDEITEFTVRHVLWASDPYARALE